MGLPQVPGDQPGDGSGMGVCSVGVPICMERSPSRHARYRRPCIQRADPDPENRTAPPEKRRRQFERAQILSQPVSLLLREIGPPHLHHAVCSAKRRSQGFPPVWRTNRSVGSVHKARMEPLSPQLKGDVSAQQVTDRKVSLQIAEEDLHSSAFAGRNLGHKRPAAFRIAERRASVPGHLRPVSND